MKRIFAFFAMLLSLTYVHLEPVDLSDIKNDTIRVTIEGAVNEPGEIELEPYARIEDALDVVSLTRDADTSTMNPQTILKDGDLLIIPSKTAQEVPRISINTGTLEELTTLPGIGETTAQSIIDYRNEHGLFQSLEDLCNVKGIGEAKFAKLKDSIAL